MPEDDDTNVPTEGRPDNDEVEHHDAPEQAAPVPAVAATQPRRPFRDMIARWSVGQRAIAAIAVLVLLGGVVFAASWHRDQAPRVGTGSSAFAACMRQHGVEVPAQAGAGAPGLGGAPPGGQFAPPGGGAPGTAPGGGTLPQPGASGFAPPGGASSSKTQDALRACQGYLQQ